MNFVKKTLVMLAFISTMLVRGRTQTLEKFGNLSFGAEETGLLFRIGTSLPPRERAKIKPAVDDYIDKCMKNKVHPFHWFENAPAGVTFTFPVSGNLKDIYRELGKIDFGKIDTCKGRPCWLWNDTLKITSLIVHLNQTGAGFLELFENDKVVGWISCQSCDRPNQPKEGTCSIVKKWTQRDDKDAFPNELGKRSITADSWMPWAMELNNTTGGIFLHGGSLLTDSLGCIRGPRPAMELLYHLSKVGMKVRIQYDD